ncbi:ParB N-terminal domain-containing protein [Ensifer sp.]|uniref:ParB/RepB/Spo0J family partition protein n=1 Tax=Ensifer sp. TaxID=1872086 RepID=UPI0028995CD1|nr:ParB N-terminal domain-containing protein [Ensifer sp.]
MNTVISIELGKLDLDPQNVRKTPGAENLQELAANIEANGLLQNLIVRKGRKGRYFVTAGGRRLRALNLLLGAGKLSSDHPVNCILRKECEATELSLAENVVREAMNPADQYEAFDALARQGMPIAKIALRFGVTEAVVQKRLALARVSPVLLDLYREGEMSFDLLSAFTISDDHIEQKRVWSSLGMWNRYPHTIKAALRGDAIGASDKRIRFIGGLDVYEAAGGLVRRDLFDSRNEGFALDVALVEQLMADKLHALAIEVKAEGWAWVEIVPEIGCGVLKEFARVYPQPIDLCDDQRATLDALAIEQGELEALVEAGEADEAAQDRMAWIEEKRDALRREAYAPDAILGAGALVALAYNGSVSIERGLIRRGSEEDGSREYESPTGDPTPTRATILHSAKFVEDLTAQKTAAMRLEFAGNHHVALASVVHALLLQTLFSCSRNCTCLEIGITSRALGNVMKAPEGNLALAGLEDLRERFGHEVPGEPFAIFDWCLEREQHELLELLAFSAGQTINAVMDKNGFRKQELVHADHLARALRLDMRSYFEPTAESYFKHLTVAGIAAAVGEIKGEAAGEGMSRLKKAQSVLQAEGAVKGTGWLPSPLRIPTSNGSVAPQGSFEVSNAAQAAE